MRVKHLSRTGMYEQAFYHIIENDNSFTYKKEDWERIKKLCVYDPKRGTTCKEFDKLCKDINNWLNEHYYMYELDYTHWDDDGSRDEVTLCYEKPEDEDVFGIYAHPDFATQLPKAVFYR